ncbi:MAG: bifunctional phosphoribosylaminoimidazolecarboxamide formyltransferase/IMP cyclohydrolase [Clostridiales bacterium]|jgi:phosphoribosylaminoimidazolecarboxamide formyltransferase/IMP cyclohydrolase|nr:bifunctional phosphoribosylaminoimidazolecarboxamide formyltransferase/IMP cyclohydrolase [Clostridiales bacterium]
MKRYALISVSDKTGVVDFAKELISLGFGIISTGGTYVALREAGIKVKNVTDVTGFPEMLDGRVKTLHPKIHAGILAVRDNTVHMEKITEYGISPIDIVVCNLYPFKQTIQKPDVKFEDAIENIDIGGPSMLRAAAKNHNDVTVIIDPDDYADVLTELQGYRKTTPELRLRLAAKVFAHTAAYDALIADYLSKEAGISKLGDTFTVTYEKALPLRYGENPHQAASFYKESMAHVGAVANIKQIHGKELSFNNINDTNGALELCREFSKPAVVAVKHQNPCGVAEAETISEAFAKAYEADKVSVFGGIIVCNREVDTATAKLMSKIFLEVILAPSFSEEAIGILSKKKDLRLLTLDGISVKQPDSCLDFKKVSGGLLVQNIDNTLLPESAFRVVTKRAPSDNEKLDLLFAWKIVKYAKSNGIAIAKNGQSLGIGSGQVNRIWAAKQAIEHAAEALGEHILEGAALASDAFFPFADCVEAAAATGITAIIQPGGSIRDKESIEACDKHNISMVFTDMRHFRH